MFDWNPIAISEKFTDEIELRQRIHSQLFNHQDWIDFDCALISEKEMIKRASERLEISLKDTEKLFEQTKKSLVLITKSLDVLNKVKSNKLNAYCLSNISPEFFKYSSTRYKLFKLFDGIVTSGVENIVKPDKRIFEILLTRYNLNPAECLFIDDSAENTATAKKMGITQIAFKGTKNCYQKIYGYIK